MNRIFAVVLLCLVLGVAACGSSGKTTTVVRTVTVPAATSPTTADTAPASTPPPATEETGCDALGINSDGLKEGTCDDANGVMVKVVNRRHPLNLRELKVRYLGYSTAQSISSDVGTEAAHGTFVILRLAVTNKLDSPVNFDDSQTQVGLNLKGKVFDEAFDAENSPNSGSFVWQDDRIAPDETRTGTVIFDVPSKHLSEVGSDGNIDVVNFSDAQDATDIADAEQSASITGVIRLYH